MKRLKTIVLFFMMAGLAFSQNSGFIPFRSVESCTGNSSLMSLSGLNNPSSLFLLDSGVLNLAFTPSRFNMRELSPAYLFYGRRLDSCLVAGGSLYSLGNHLYRELSSSVYFSYSISKMIVCGAAVEYGHISIRSYDSDYCIRFNFGGHLFLSESLTAAFSFSNVNGDSYFGEENTLQRKAAFALAYELQQGLFLELGALIALKRSSGFNLSSKYIFNDYLSARLSYSSNPVRAEAALKFGFAGNYFGLFQVSYHSYLGMHSGLALGIYL